MHPSNSSIKKIRCITDFYPPSIGGIEKWVFSIASLLSQHFSVTVVAHPPGFSASLFRIHSPFSPVCKQYPDVAGVPVDALSPSCAGRLLLAGLFIWNIPVLRRVWRKGLFDLLYVFYRCAFIRKLRNLLQGSDVVHCFSTGYLAVCTTEVCSDLAIPLVHSPPVHFERWGDSPLLLRSYARAGAIMCLSQLFKTEFTRRLPNADIPIVVNPAPVSPPVLVQKPGFHLDAPSILFIGRREEYKGVSLLLSAYKKLTHRAQLVVVGPGGPVAADGCDIVDAGAVDEAVKHWLLDHCAIFCVPSSDESFGIVFAEAMMHAKPVVALDIAPVNEVVINGETGILVPRGREDLLAGALDSLLCDPLLMRRMGNKGYQRYRELFEGEKVLERIVRIYNDLPR